jgi:hypothetical protein
VFVIGREGVDGDKKQFPFTDTVRNGEKGIGSANTERKRKKEDSGRRRE